MRWGIEMPHGRVSKAASSEPNLFPPACLLICACLFSISALPARAQRRAAGAALQIPLTVAQGVPLRIAFTQRVPIPKRAGTPVEGRLVAPIFVYNREVIPTGTSALGHIIKVRGLSRYARTRSLMNGDFTPWRTAEVSFDTLVLKDGTRIPIATNATLGVPHVVRLVSGGSKEQKKGFVARKASKELGSARRQLKAQKDQALSEIRSPGRMHRLWKFAKSTLDKRLPYHRQAYPAGTQFTAVLEQPIHLGTERVPTAALAHVGSAPPPDSTIDARLVTPLNSATAKRGTLVRAIVTRPLFSSDDHLIIPEGTRLEGRVIRVRAARWLHRDGSLRFAFERMVPPAGEAQFMPGSLVAAVVPRKGNLHLDREGGVKAKSSKKRYLAPALSLWVATIASTPDYDARMRVGGAAAVPNQGGGLATVAAGGWGLGLVGSVVAMLARSRVVSGALGYYGAAGSFYSKVIARGSNVSFAANTPMEISLGTHRHPPRSLKPPPARASASVK